MDYATKSSALAIRQATSHDFAMISKLNLLTKRPQRTDLQLHEYLVAEINSELVGCAALRCRRDSGYLYGLTVHPDWRRQGIGHSLTDRRLEAIRAQGLHHAVVFAMFWNVKFFKRHGFVLTNRSRASELRWLHKDFEDAWCRRSALLSLSFDASHTQFSAE